jgi:hypothetical protein
MFHAYVQRFDVTGNLKILAKFLASKRCHDPDTGIISGGPGGRHEAESREGACVVRAVCRGTGHRDGAALAHVNDRMEQATRARGVAGQVTTERNWNLVRATAYPVS